MCVCHDVNNNNNLYHGSGKKMKDVRKRLYEIRIFAKTELS